MANNKNKMERADGEGSVFNGCTRKIYNIYNKEENYKQRELICPRVDIPSTYMPKSTTWP